MVRIDDSPAVMDLPFMVIPDFHGEDCAQYFDMGPAIRNMSPWEFESAFITSQYPSFMDMIDEGNETRDLLFEYATGDRPDIPYLGGNCDECLEEWGSDEGYEVVPEFSTTEVFSWFITNRPDLLANNLITPEVGRRRYLRMVINRRDA